MRCFRIERVLFLEDGTTERQVFFQADESVAQAVYRTFKQEAPGGDERSRGVFLDRLEISSDVALAYALEGAQCSRYELHNLTAITQTREAF